MCRVRTAREVQIECSMLTIILMLLLPIRQGTDSSEVLTLARLHFKNGELALSRQLFLSALQASDLYDREVRAHILMELGDVYAGLDEVPKAEQAYNESLEIYTRQSDTLHIAILLRRVGLAYSID